MDRPDEGDLKTLEFQDWRETVQDRDRTRSVAMAAKTLKQWTVEGEKDN